MIHHDTAYLNFVIPKARGAPPDGVHTTLSTHCNTVENQRGADSQDRAVGATSTTFVAEHLLITS